MNDLLLLSTLLDAPKHGYALKKQIALITGQGEMHNNLVYPLLKRFVANGWVSRRETAGERGQTRELYALTAKGRQEIVNRLSDFSPKLASSAEGFSFRVGLFEILESSARNRILDEREKWLTERAQKLATLSEAMQLGQWAGEVVKFLRAQAVSEQKWIARLRKKNHNKAAKP
jgi:DNA-binding PadR family transcriptional regulator